MPVQAGTQVHRPQVIPAGDDRERFVCETCATIHYQNPRMVVGTIPEWEDRILLCRRAIEPRAGQWTLPAGYLENGETMIDGARRVATMPRLSGRPRPVPFARVVT